MRKSSALLFLAAATACGRAPVMDLAIAHVSVVDLERGVMLPDRTVLVRNGRIQHVDSASRRGVRATRSIDGAGQFVIPGLWDMHVHIGDDERTLNRLLGWGITGARDMDSSPDEMLALQGRLRAPSPLPRLVFVGPALRGPRSAADSGVRVVRTTDDGRRVVAELAGRGLPFIKVHEGLSREVWYSIAHAARGAGVSLVGHVPQGLAPSEAADSGLRGIEHLEFLPDECLLLLDSTHQAAAATAPEGCRPLELERLLSHLHRKGVWLEPTIGSFRIWAPRQWPSILTGFAGLVPAIRRAALPLLAGTDLGSTGIIPGESLHDELALLVQAGFPPAEALRAATSNPATFLGLADSLGAVRPGYVADLLVLGANPLVDIRNTRRITTVVRTGVVVDAAALDSLRR